MTTTHKGKGEWTTKQDSKDQRPMRLQKEMKQEREGSTQKVFQV
jgi:hypothetical protein